MMKVTVTIEKITPGPQGDKLDQVVSLSQPCTSDKVGKVLDSALQLYHATSPHATRFIFK